MSQFFIKTGNYKYILNQILIILLIFIPFFELFCQNSIDLIKNDTSVIIIDSLTNKIDSIKQKSDIETTVKQSMQILFMILLVKRLGSPYLLTRMNHMKLIKSLIILNPKRH